MDQQVKQERLQGRLGPEIKEFRQGAVLYSLQR